MLELKGHIVAIESRVGTLNTGLYEGQPVERVVVRVNRLTPDGYLVTEDADRNRRVVNAEAVIEDLGPAKAGWATW